MTRCSNDWLITYDDCPKIRDNFKSSNIFEWEVQYGMNNYKQDSAAKGKELFISNYEAQRNSNKNSYKTTEQLNLFKQA